MIRVDVHRHGLRTRAQRAIPTAAHPWHRPRLPSWHAHTGCGSSSLPAYGTITRNRPLAPVLEQHSSCHGLDADPRADIGYCPPKVRGSGSVAPPAGMGRKVAVAGQVFSRIRAEGRELRDNEGPLAAPPPVNGRLTLAQKGFYPSYNLASSHRRPYPYRMTELLSRYTPARSAAASAGASPRTYRSHTCKPCRT